MITGLRHFRIIVKTGEHPTESLTLRCFDMLAIHAEEARSLCAERRRNRNKHLVVREVRDQPLTEFQHAQLLSRLERYRRGA